MNFKEEHTTLFDDYLTGSMTDKDKSLFEEKISGNHEFKTEFMAYKTFISAVEEALNYEVTRNIKLGEIKYQKNRLIKGLMVFVSLLILAIVGIKLFLPTKKKMVQEPILKVENLEKTSSKEIETIDSLKKENKELVKVREVVKTTHTLPSANKEKKARIVVNVDFVKVKEFSFKKLGREVYIYSPQKINEIVSFKKNNTSYLSVNGVLYKETLDSYEKALDNRLIQGISRSSGQGKQLTFTVFYYKKAWVKEVVLQASNEPYLRNDTLFSVQEKMVLPASVYRFKTQEVYTTREKFFTVEDIMHLEGNN